MTKHVEQPPSLPDQKEICLLGLEKLAVENLEMELFVGQN
jgi:hypothetical protein